MRTYEQIYNDLTTKTEQYTLRELIRIFENENSWIGSTWQLMKLKEIHTEITGIRAGNCSGCNIDVMINMIRWVNKYEAEHQQVETQSKKRRK